MAGFYIYILDWTGLVHGGRSADRGGAMLDALGLALYGAGGGREGLVWQRRWTRDEPVDPVARAAYALHNRASALAVIQASIV